MSNAIAQSTAKLGVTNELTEEQWMSEGNIKSRIRNHANVKASGLTIERRLMNAEKIADKVRKEFRDRFSGVYAYNQSIPTVYNDLILKLSYEFVSESLGMVNVKNVVSNRRYPYWRANEDDITERITNTGENMMSLSEQHFWAGSMITECERRMKNHIKNNTLTPDLQVKIQDKMNALNITLSKIKERIASENALVKQIPEIAKIPEPATTPSTPANDGLYTPPTGNGPIG